MDCHRSASVTTNQHARGNPYTLLIGESDLSSDATGEATAAREDRSDRVLYSALQRRSNAYI